MKALTDKQLAVLQFIHLSIERIGFAPTIDEIRIRCGYRSETSVTSHLNALVKKGYIKRTQGRVRNITLVGVE